MSNENTNSNETNNSVRGVWATLKYVIITICKTVVKGCEVVDTAVDSTHDIVKTAKVYSSQIHDEALINAKSDIAKLQSDLNTNS